MACTTHKVIAKGKTMNKYEIIKISEFGHKVIDKTTNECVWDVPTGSCVFTLHEATQMIKKLGKI